MSDELPVKRLVMDRQHLIAMLSDPQFFVACPVFMWLRQTALTQAEAYRRSAAKNCCGGDWKLLRPVVDAFFHNLRELHAADRNNVECVREYLTQKKRYVPRPVVLFYRASKKGKPLKFDF